MTRRAKWIAACVILFCAIAIPMTTYATTKYFELPSSTHHAHDTPESQEGIDLDLSALSALLGIDADEIASALQQGKSISDIAEQHHIDLQQVIDSQVAKYVERLDHMRADNKITDEQYDKLKTQFTDQLSYYLMMLSGTKEPISPNLPKK